MFSGNTNTLTIIAIVITERKVLSGKNASAGASGKKNWKIFDWR